MQVTAQLLLDHGSPRAVAAQLFELTRDSGGAVLGGSGSVLGPSAAVAPYESPPASVTFSTTPTEWGLSEFLAESRTGRGSGICPLDPTRLRASGAVVHGARAWQRDTPTLFYLPGLPGVCTDELAQLCEHLSEWRVVERLVMRNLQRRRRRRLAHLIRHTPRLLESL